MKLLQKHGSIAFMVLSTASLFTVSTFSASKNPNSICFAWWLQSFYQLSVFSFLSFLFTNHDEFSFSSSVSSCVLVLFYFDGTNKSPASFPAVALAAELETTISTAVEEKSNVSELAAGGLRKGVPVTQNKNNKNADSSRKLHWWDFCIYRHWSWCEEEPPFPTPAPARPPPTPAPLPPPPTPAPAPPSPTPKPTPPPFQLPNDDCYLVDHHNWEICP